MFPLTSIVPPTQAKQSAEWVKREKNPPEIGPRHEKASVRQLGHGKCLHWKKSS